MGLDGSRVNYLLAIEITSTFKFLRSHIDIHAGRVALVGDERSSNIVQCWPLPQPVQRVRARGSSILGELDIVLTREIISHGSEFSSSGFRKGRGVVLIALSIIERPSCKEFAPFVASSARFIPDSMDAQIGIGIGRLLCSIDKDRSTSYWLCRRPVKKRDMTILFVYESDIVSRSSNQCRVSSCLVANGLARSAHEICGQDFRCSYASVWRYLVL